MLAESPKSVRTYKAYGKAKALVANEEAWPVPMHIRNAPTGLMKSLGVSFAGFRSSVASLMFTAVRHSTDEITSTIPATYIPSPSHSSRPSSSVDPRLTSCRTRTRWKARRTMRRR